MLSLIKENPFNHTRLDQLIKEEIKYERVKNIDNIILLCCQQTLLVILPQTNIVVRVLQRSFSNCCYLFVFSFTSYQNETKCISSQMDKVKAHGKTITYSLS